MNLHDADIRARLLRFLDRKQMPKRLDGKGGALEDEIRALVSAILRNAPRSTDRLADWWPLFEASIGEICGGMWPTEREVRDAAQRANADAPKVAAEPWSLDPAEMAAKRMQAGEPVGEEWLYGIGACELAAKRLVTEDQMRAYRSGAFLSRREAYGEESALAWEAEAKDKHEKAKDMWRHRQDMPQRRDIRLPSKRETPGWGDAA